jgi:uncharacterized iron-regulated membrane protein
MRRFLFQVHLWIGVLIGLYVVVVCVSGAALVFRIDMQRAIDPLLFTPTVAGPLADPVAIMESVSGAYPQYRLSGVDAPTTLRPTYLAYVTSGDEFRTVLIDPVTTAVLGALPERAAIRTLQDLHYNLLGGRTGRMINGIGAFGILVMCATGLVIWWPGGFFSRRAPRRAEGTSPTSEASPTEGRQHHRQWQQLHRAIGAWSAAFILMSAVTGLSFVFPTGFRSVVTDHGGAFAAVGNPVDEPAALVAADDRPRQATRGWPGRRPGGVAVRGARRIPGDVF